MQTLKWPADGGSIDLTDEWTALTSLDGGGGLWYWLAQRWFDQGTIGEHRLDGYPTERAAQLACEAFCWRNGILPLPEWSGWHDEGRPSAYLECAPVPWAKATILAVGGWHVWRGAGTAARVVAAGGSGYFVRQVFCPAAERHLRCEIAAALEAEAAKEGAA